MIRDNLQDDDSRSDEMDRLHWQCRRGMLELDELFERFLNTGYPALAASEKSLFAELLKEPDPDLYQWLLIDEHCSGPYESLLRKIKGSR